MVTNIWKVRLQPGSYVAVLPVNLTTCHHKTHKTRQSHKQQHEHILPAKFLGTFVLADYCGNTNYNTTSSKV
jgi:hypothetical protein